jgi:hypothetical protein
MDSLPSHSALQQMEWLNTKPHVGGIQYRMFETGLELAVLTELFFSQALKTNLLAIRESIYLIGYQSSY